MPENEPQPDATRPTCPAWMCKEAKAEWKRVVPQLYAMGVLTKIDRTMLETYCETYAKFRAAQQFIHKHGPTYQFPKKANDGTIISVYVAPWPQVSIARACADQIRAFCTEFGMSPSSRARMVVPGTKEEEDPLELLLSKGRQN